MQLAYTIAIWSVAVLGLLAGVFLVWASIVWYIDWKRRNRWTEFRTQTVALGLSGLVFLALSASIAVGMDWWFVLADVGLMYLTWKKGGAKLLLYFNKQK